MLDQKIQISLYIRFLGVFLKLWHDSSNTCFHMLKKKKNTCFQKANGMSTMDSLLRRHTKHQDLDESAYSTAFSTSTDPLYMPQILQRACLAQLPASSHTIKTLLGMHHANWSIYSQTVQSGVPQLVKKDIA